MNEMLLSVLKGTSQDFERGLNFGHVPLVQQWDLGFQPGVRNISQRMYKSGKMKGEGKGLKKKKLCFWNINRLEIVTESSA